MPIIGRKDAKTSARRALNTVRTMAGMDNLGRTGRADLYRRIDSNYGVKPAPAAPAPVAAPAPKRVRRTKASAPQAAATVIPISNPTHDAAIQASYASTDKYMDPEREEEDRRKAERAAQREASNAWFREVPDEYDDGEDEPAPASTGSGFRHLPIKQLRQMLRERIRKANKKRLLSLL